MNAPPRSWAKKRRSTAPRTRDRCQPTRRSSGLLNRGPRKRCTIDGHPATAMAARRTAAGRSGTASAPRRGRRSVAVRRRLHQLDVGDRGDRADHVLGPDAGRQAELELDLVAALADPLAVDPGHLDAPVGEEPRHVAEGLEPADLEAEPDRVRDRACGGGRSSALSGHSENTTMNVPTAAISHSPAPAAIPIAAAVHRLAAVVRPRIEVPYLRIAPAPRKPIPDTIWAAIRVGSTFGATPFGAGGPLKP